MRHKPSRAPFDLEAALREAHEAHGRQEIALAERRYREIITHRDDPRAQHGLGVLLCQTGHGKEGERLIRRAIERDPKNLDYLFDLAVALLGRGDGKEALDVLQKILRQDPENVQARRGLVQAQLSLNQVREAIPNLHLLVKLDPTDPRAWRDLGSASERVNDAAGAARAFAEADRLKPRDPDVLWALARAYVHLDRKDDAINTLFRMVAVAPLRYDARLGIASLLASKGRYQDAAEATADAAKLRPRDALIHHTLAIAQIKAHQADEALVAAARAYELEPNSVIYQAGLIKAMREAGDFYGARAKLDEFIAKNPLPDFRALRALMLPIVIESNEETRQLRAEMNEQLDQLMAEDVRLTNPLEIIGFTNFHLGYQGIPERELVEKIGRFYAQCFPSLVYRSPNLDRPPLEGRKIRVGFLSSHLWNHSISVVLARFPILLDRDRFEPVYLRASVMREPHDEIAMAIETREIPRQLEPARAAIEAANLDILLFVDLQLDLVTDLLSHSRLAPIQCVTWGHPGTSGLPSIDYWISSAGFEGPEGPSHYSERLVTIPSPLVVTPKRPRIDPAPTRAELGIDVPADRKLYLCPQTVYKLHPDFDDLLKRILDCDPAAQIVLIASERPSYIRATQARMKRTIGETDRITWLPRLPIEQYQGLLRMADVVLDTLHFSGGISALEILAQGAPFVTLPGPAMRSRMSAAFLTHVGVTETIAENLDDYVKIAFRLAHDTAWKEGLSDRILAGLPNLFDNEKAAEELGDLFEAMAYGRV